MADHQASSSPLSKTPFDWLQGGLFSLGKSSSRPKSNGIESIESSKDVMALLTGISENLDEILAIKKEEASAAAAVAAASKKEEDSTDDDKADTTTKEEAATTTKDSNNAVKNSNESNAAPTAFDFIAARLSRLRFLLYDERRMTSSQPESRRSNPTIAGTTVQGLTGEQHQNLIPHLLENLSSLPFESRKHVAAIFNYLLVSGMEGADAALYHNVMQLFADFVRQNFHRIMTIIVQGHDSSSSSNNTNTSNNSSNNNNSVVVARPATTVDVGLHCGAMYRSCLRHASLYRELVRTTECVHSYVFPFLDVYVHLPNFEISSDAMESLRVAFCANGDRVTQDEETAAARAAIAAEFLTRDYVEIWDERFNPKLLSPDGSANYMTRRVALQILSSVLLTRSNYAVMIRYVASRANLITVMTLLRDTSPHITLDAFHVFKVFVANPNKPPEVIKILKDNKVKLCRYLTTLHQEKEESDAQFRDEKALIIATINEL